MADWLFPFAQAVQQLAAVRALQTSLWAYPLISALHIAGFALLFGAIAVVDTRLLWAGRWQMPERHALSLALLGFALAAGSGVTIWSVKAVEYLGQPVFWFKLAVIAAAGANAGLLHLVRCRGRCNEGRDASRMHIRAAAGFSLLAWSTVILLGRLLGFL